MVSWINGQQQQQMHLLFGLVSVSFCLPVCVHLSIFHLHFSSWKITLKWVASYANAVKTWQLMGFSIIYCAQSLLSFFSPVISLAYLWLRLESASGHSSSSSSYGMVDRLTCCSPVTGCPMNNADNFWHLHENQRGQIDRRTDEKRREKWGRKAKRTIWEENTIWLAAAKHIGSN